MERIAHVSLHGDPLEPLGSIEAGGQNVYVKNVATKQSEAGVQVDVFTRWNHPDKPRVEEIAPGARSVRLKGGPVEFVKKERLVEFIPEMLDEFARFCESNDCKYDIIHTHYYVEGAFGMKLAERHHLPQFHTFHSLGRIKLNHELLQGAPDQESYRGRLEVEKDLMSECDRLVATSPFEADDFRDWYSHHNGNTVVVPCGLDPSMFRSRGRRNAREKVALPQDKTIILYVGRLDPRKGLETLLFAYRKLLFDLGTKADDVLLVIVGGNPDPAAGDSEFDHFRAMARSLQLSEMENRKGSLGNVLFAGSQEQRIVAQYYAAADFTVVPSCYEPFGMVAIETQACGTPAIVSAVGGLRYAVENGIGGLHVKPYSAADLSDKMLQLVLDSDLRHRLARCGKQRVMQKFTWTAVSQELLGHYEKVLCDRNRNVLPLRRQIMPMNQRAMLFGRGAAVADRPAPGTMHPLPGA